MKPDGQGSEGKGSLTLRRSNARRRAEPEGRASGQAPSASLPGMRAGTPAKVRGGQSARVPSDGSAVPQYGDEPENTDNVSVSGGTTVTQRVKPVSYPARDETDVVPAPLVPPDAGLSYYKGVSLKHIGYDKGGRVIPHVRNEKIAKQIAVWIAGGADINAICIRLNMRPGKFKELYPNEIATGLDQVGMDLTTSIYQRAKKSDRLAIFFAKARLGWRDGDGAARETNLLNLHIHL